MADPNTRQGKRTPVTLKIKFKSETLEQFIERYAVDVSQGGIFIRTKDPLAVGTQMRFEFQLRDASPLIAGEGTVVWTRENDPSRPAIAPGMGVRFDRLADGSQSILERILSEKAKQAPQRGGEITKQPLFTDTPTRVAPAPVQEALLGADKSARHKGPTGGEFESHTPLPKPVPFHSDADEFPDEAFEEATKVRALDDLIAQTADDAGSAAAAQELFSGRPPSKLADDLAVRRSGGIRNDATLSDPPATAAAAAASVSVEESASDTLAGFGPSGIPERDSAPILPSPPDSPKQPRLLDTSPSPRTDESGSINNKAALIAQNDRMEKLAKTKIGMEPAYVATRSGSASTPPPSQPPVARDALTRPSGNAIAEMPRSRAASAAPPIAEPPPAKSSKAPLIILLLVVLAAGAAGVWFFVLREKAVENNKTNVATGSDKGSDTPGSGSDKVAVGSDKAGSGEQPIVEPPKGPMIDIEISASAPKAEVEVVGIADGKGPAPLKTKLEKDKAYKVRVSAPGYATLEQEVKGGADTWAAKLIAKPRVITVTSEPAGALIMIDGAPVNHVTPFDVELTKAQGAKKSVRVSLRKAGFRPVDKMIDLGTFAEEDIRMLGKLDAKLVVQQVVIQRPPPDVGSGSATPPGPGSGDGPGSATPPPGGGSDAVVTPPEPPKDPPKEPTPEFVNP